MNNLNFFILYNRLRNKHAQIATMFTLIIAVIFLFVVVTMNIARVANLKTAVSKASDSSALLLASYLGSYSRMLWEYNEQHLRNCETNWGGILAIIIVIILIIIVIMTGQIQLLLQFPDLLASLSALSTSAWAYGITTGSILGAIAIPTLAVLGIAAASYNAYNYFNDQHSAMRTANKKMQNLPVKDQFREMAIQNALMSLLDDSVMAIDVNDLDEDGQVVDRISRFDKWYLQRVNNLVLMEEKGELNTALNNLKDAFNDLYDNLHSEGKGYNIWYLDEESDFNAYGFDYSGTYPDDTNNNSTYLDDDNDDFISLLYDIVYGKYKDVRGLESLSSYIDFWISPKIPEGQDYQDYEEYKEEGDKVDELLLGFRGEIDVADDGFLGFVKMIKKMEKKYMKNSIETWLSALLSDEEEVDLWGEEGDGDGYEAGESDTDYTAEIEAWVGYLDDWEGKFSQMIALVEGVMDGIGDELLQECIERLETAYSHLGEFYSDLMTIKDQVDLFRGAYQRKLDAEDSDGDDISSEYKKMAVYSWKQTYQDGTEKWHHIRAYVPTDYKLPYIKTSSSWTRICYTLKDHTGEVKVQTAKFTPDSEDINFAGGEGSSAVKLWGFKNTSAGYGSNSFDVYDTNGESNGDPLDEIEGVIDEKEVFFVENNGKVVFIGQDGVEQMHNQRLGLLNAGIKSFATAKYSCFPENRSDWFTENGSNWGYKDLPYSTWDFDDHGKAHITDYD